MLDPRIGIPVGEQAILRVYKPPAMNRTALSRLIPIVRLVTCLTIWTLSALGETSSAATTGEIPGYVVLPLVNVGYHAAGVHVTLDGRPTVMSIATASTRSDVDRYFYHGQLFDPNTQTVPGVPLDFKTTAQLEPGRKKLALVTDLQSGRMVFGAGLMGVTNANTGATAYNPTNIDVRLGGVIGDDILTTYGAIIDWRRHGIYFNTDPSKRMHPHKALVAAGWTAVPLVRTSYGRLALNTMIDNRSFALVINTAAVLTVIDSSALASPDRMSQKTLILSRDGYRFPAHPVTLGNWMLGSYRIKSFAVAAAPAPNPTTREEIAGGPQIAGFLGAEVLARHNAIIDVNGATLYLKPPQGS